MDAEVGEPARAGGGWLLPLLLFLGVGALYLPSTGNGFIYDDHKLILEHPGAHDLGDVAQVFREPHFPRFPYYRPITRTTLVVQKGLHGDSAAPFHGFNALLMGAMAVACYGLLRRPQWRIGRGAAALASAAFCAHPVASTVVYPICSGRETLVPALVIVLATTAWLSSGWRARALAHALLAVALFCKEQAIVLPALFLLADALGLTPGGRPASLRSWILRHAPGALICGAYLLVRHAIFGGNEYDFVVLDHPLGPLQSFLFAGQVMLAPFVAVVYEPPVEVWLQPLRVGWTLLALGAIVVAARRWKAVSRPVTLFWLAWFLLFSLPTANILRQEAKFAERYVFLAALPLVAVLAATARAAAASTSRRRVLVGAGAVLSLAFAGISLSRAPTYSDDVAFAEQWLATNPDAYEARYSLGFLARRDGDAEAAREHFAEAIRIQPTFADAQLGLAWSLIQLGRGDEALHHAREGGRSLPDDSGVQQQVGTLLLDLRRVDEARRFLERARDLDPARPDPYNELGRAACQAGRLDEGLELFREALRRDPSFNRARFNLAYTLGIEERWEEARREYEIVLAREPEHRRARFGHAECLWWLGRAQEAQQELTPLLRSEPIPAELVLAGRLAADRGETGRALQILEPIPHREAGRETAWIRATAEDAALRDGAAALAIAEALQAARTSPEVLHLRAAAKAESGDRAGAAADLERALERLPDDAPARALLRRHQTLIGSGHPLRSKLSHASEWSGRRP